MNLWGLYLMRPWWLLALLPCALLLLFARHHHLRASEWSGAIDEHLRKHLLQRAGNINMPLIIIAIGWLLTILALSGPAWHKIPHPLQQSEAALIMVLDLSPSMYAQDIAPSRLERARNKLNDVLDRKQEGLTGLVAYGADAYSITPLTDDTDTVRNLLNALSPETLPRNAWGSNPVAALAEAQQIMTGGGVQRARILLVTDGVSKQNAKNMEAFLESGAMKLSILGIGTPNGAPVPLPTGGFLRDTRGQTIVANFNPATMRSLVQSYAGRYRSLTLDDSDIIHLLPENQHDAGTRESEREFDLWREEGPWLIPLILPLAVLGFRRGWLLSLSLFFLASLTPTAHALQWRDLWQRADQQAAKLAEKEQYADAANQFQDPHWRGFVQYKDGNYADALENLPQEGDARLHYNRGNTLAQMGRLSDAISAYDAAIDLDPDFQDARDNRTLLESIQQGQQQQGEQQQGQQQQGEQQQGEQQQGQQQGGQQQSQQQQGEQGQQQSQNSDAQSQSSENQNQNSAEQEQASQEYLKNIAERAEQEAQNAQQNQDNKTQNEDTNNAQQAKEDASQQARTSQTPATGQNADNSNPEDIDDLATLLRQEGSADPKTEREQTIQTWLRQIPDNPADLLKKKLYYQQVQRERENRSRVPEDNPGL